MRLLSLNSVNLVHLEDRFFGELEVVCSASIDCLNFLYGFTGPCVIVGHAQEFGWGALLPEDSTSAAAVRT